jgi:hypothetical protein
VKPSEKYRRNQQLVLKKRRDTVNKMLSVFEKSMTPSNPPEAVVSNNRKEGGIDRNLSSEDRADRIEWSKFSTQDTRGFLRTLGSEERREFIGGMARLAKEGIQERAEIDKLLGEAELYARLGGALSQYMEARGTSNIPQRTYEASEGQNVAPVTPEVTVSVADVTPRFSQKSHDVTVVASEVTAVTPPSVLVRAKRGEDGLYHCRECDYVTDRAGTLRMHRFRKHPKDRM